jgi:hypothetical protein
LIIILRATLRTVLELEGNLTESRLCQEFLNQILQCQDQELIILSKLLEKEL